MGIYWGVTVDSFSSAQAGQHQKAWREAGRGEEEGGGAMCICGAGGHGWRLRGWVGGPASTARRKEE